MLCLRLRLKRKPFKRMRLMWYRGPPGNVDTLGRSYALPRLQSLMWNLRNIAQFARCESVERTALPASIVSGQQNILALNSAITARDIVTSVQSESRCKETGANMVSFCAQIATGKQMECKICKSCITEYHFYMSGFYCVECKQILREVHGFEVGLCAACECIGFIYFSSVHRNWICDDCSADVIRFIYPALVQMWFISVANVKFTIRYGLRKKVVGCALNVNGSMS